MTPLPPDRWPEVERLFAAACDSADAGALLDAAEPALAAEVRALLAADHAVLAGDAPLADLATLLAEAGRDLVPDADAGLAPGTRVGPWTVEDEIGAGGMGVVYRARRADGVHDEAVALKVVRRGMDSAQVVRRFAQERAVLASLDHPAIARLLDGGTTPDGRPFLVLDLVPGEPVTAYADRHHATVEQRVRLVVQVCEAVAHAHRRLVVHRDLKPSNILVADPEAPGAAPRVTLLDFGVAHLLSPPPEALTLTGDGPRPMTPEYAAPEQLAGEAVTTATDVYALGVVLYELLAGRRPHASAGRAPTALALAIRDAPPARPSTAATRAGEAPAAAPDAVARARASTPDRLRARLRGDLDAVVLKALRPEPEARYASVDALADDLRRHLAGRPVLARGGGARYRAGRFVRRHRWGVAAGALVIALVAASVAVVVVQSRRVAREAAQSAAVAGFLETLLAASDPAQGLGREPTVRSVLDEGARRLSTDLAGQPAVQARMMTVVGSAYTAIGRYREAERLLTDALRRQRTLGGPDAPAALDAQEALADLATEHDDLARAGALLRDALARRERDRPRRHRDGAHARAPRPNRPRHRPAGRGRAPAPPGDRPPRRRRPRAGPRRRRRAVHPRHRPLGPRRAGRCGPPFRADAGPHARAQRSRAPGRLDGPRQPCRRALPAAPLRRRRAVGR